MRRFLSRAFVLGAVVGSGYAAWRFLKSLRGESRSAPPAKPAPPPLPSQPADVHIPSQLRPPGGPETTELGATWVEPVQGVCPTSHPVKATLSSGTFQLPDEPSYESTVPDRCYRDAPAAEADGLRPPTP